MKHLLILILLLPTLSSAGDVETKYFSLTLPDNFHVETDKSSRLLAFGGNSPRDLPFLSIEFGPRVTEQFSDILLRINQSLSGSGKSLEKIDCKGNCEAHYVEATQEMNEQSLTQIHYAVKSDKISFIISYGTQNNSEKQFVLNIGEQILNGI